MLAGDAHAGAKAVRKLLEVENQRAEFNGFGAGSKDKKNVRGRHFRL
jgi:hypothetical protein